ncbi:PadR family transcriptional regulator [Streptomyces goshikiensis]|uniref:PadR family transcriptional regulator n=1 Tax=Streptomyces goshikiensis TaxID=1942 RepID=UPI00364AE216
MATPRLTKPTIGVLEVLLAAAADTPAWGLSICRDADLGSGTVYPILDRLSEHGWIRSWNETDAHPGRPPRRYYELTASGRRLAAQVLERRARSRGLRVARAATGAPGSPA